MEFDTIIVDKEEHIGKVTLDRPDVLNTMNLRLVDELNEALTDLAQERDV